MKTSRFLFPLALALLVGIAIGTFAPLRKGAAPLADLENAVGKPDEDNLSRVVFSYGYGKVKNCVELRFDRKAALIDGEVFSGDNLVSAIKMAKDRKNARYLSVVGGEKDSFGTLVEAVSSLRNLGFDEVVLMANVRWEDDGYHRIHPEWLHSP